MCGVVDAKAADGFEKLAGLGREDLDATATCDGEGFGR